MTIIAKTIEKLKEYKLYTMITTGLLVVAILLIAIGHSTQATAENEQDIKITAPRSAVSQDILVTAERSNEHYAIPIDNNDGLPISSIRGIPAVSAGLSKNPEVTLTANQADYVAKFGQYLASIGQAAVVTSGERSPENQLGIIKQRIDERGAMSKFPMLANATLADTKVWMAAWQWLRARHVPVNAPVNVAGAEISNHLKGMAIDFVGKSLDQVDSWLQHFSSTKLGKSTALYITSIAREPGCVHINLAPRA